MKSHLTLALKILRMAVGQPVYAGGLVRKKIRLARRYRWIRRHEGRDGRVPPPLVYKLVLTYTCNLRCRGCFQWGTVGWCRNETTEAMARELDWEIVQRLIDEVGPARPDFILTGGEPLVYSRFEDLAARLKHHRCQTTICTNGTLLQRHAALAGSNPYLAFLVSLDGPEEVNDAIRGKGGYEKVVENIRRIKGLKKPGWVGIQCTLRPENVGHLHDFCREMVGLGVDWILLNPFWFITEEEAEAYERLMESQFHVTAKNHRGFVMPCDIDIGTFMHQYESIQAEAWPVQISSYFRRPGDIRAYLEDPVALIKGRCCHKQWIRADITPEGDVAPCIQFPDLIAGNLRDRSVLDIWNGPVYEKLRNILRRDSLPVCAKCNNIYLYDAKRKYL